MKKETEQEMKSSSKLVVVPLLLIVVMMSISLLSVAHATAVISTDKADYSPGSTVHITGQNFWPGSSISITVYRPDGSTNNCPTGPLSTAFSPCPLSSDSSGNFVVDYSLDGIFGNYNVTAVDSHGGTASTTFTDFASVDFRQCANMDSPFPLNSCHWINGALQSSDSRYAEGMSVAQRAIFDSIPAATGNMHTLTFSVQFTKGGIHAYDWLTAYNQGNSPALTLNPCGPNIGNSPDFATICTSLRSGSNTILVTVPGDPFSSNNLGTPQTVQSKITPYETAFGTRQIKLYGNSAISTASLSLAHNPSGSGSDTGDSDIDYTLTWTSSSTQLLIEMAGHLAVGGSKAASGIDWGLGRGASAVSGGPYHFSLDKLDGHSLGSQDNQIQTSTITAVLVNVSCSTKGTTNKPVSCTATASGGTPPYSYTFSAPGGTPSSGSGSGASFTFSVTYSTTGTKTVSVTVTDAAGATNTQTVSVVINAQPKTLNVSCGTATAGKAVTCNATSQGGTLPITFSWSAPGGSPSTGTGSSFTTTYPTKGTANINVTQTDGDGLVVSRVVAVTITQQPFTATASCGTGQTAGKPFSCTVSATGGTAPYGGTGTFQRTEAVKGSHTESFTVTDSNGKSSIASTTVTVAQQTFTATVNCGTGQTAGKPFSCTVSATGGTAPYGGTGDFTITQPVKGTFTESFSVTDANGKHVVASTQVTVVQQPFVVTVACGSQTTAITAGKPFTCVVSATGGTAPYGGTGDFTRTEPKKGTFTESFNVTDANGKSAIASTQVTVVQQPFVVSVTCSSPTASITAGKPFTCRVTATGGTAPYQGTGTFTVTQPVKGTFTESFTVTDGNGKSAIASTQVTVVQQPFVATVNCGSGQTAGKPFTCIVSATGGTAPYQGTGDFQVTQPVKGTFTESFIVTDSNGKSTVASTQVTVVQQPFVVSVDCGSGQTAGKPFTCRVTATGGTAPYQGTGTFPVTQPVKGTFTESFTVTDSNGKSAVVSQTVNVVQQPFVVSVTCGSATAAITAGKPFTCSVSATGGTAPYHGTGTFTIIEPVKGTFVERFAVSDSNGKTAVASVQVTVVQQPFVVSVTCGSATSAITAGKPFTCTVSATGGTAPYQGTGDFQVTEPVKGTFPESFTVRDANGKSAIASTDVTVVQQPFVVSVACGSSTAAITAGKPFTCTVSATGGTAPYQGTGNFTVTQPVKGTFTESFTVRDANGKSAIASTQVTVVQQPFVVSVTCRSPTASITAGKPFTCTVSATGGTAPYQGTGSFTVTEPVKGTFTESFTVADANGKSSIASTTVTVVQQPFVVSATCGSAAPITAGKPFTCAVSATGGTAPYQGTGTFTVTQPVKGTFTESFTVTDANGKSSIASTQVTVVQQPFVVSVTCGSAAPITAGKPFSCTVSATGGTAPYQGTGTFTVTQPVKGTFTESFTVRDANGKSAIASTQVTVVQQPFVATVNCGSGQTAGKPFTCTVSATGGTAPYQGTGTFTVTQPVKGTFTESFTVADANGKSAVASTQVTVVQQPFGVTVTCGSAAPITAGKPFNCTVSATGGTAPYQGTGTVSITEPVKGTFTESFTVRDANGKSAIASTQVTVVQQPFVVTVTCGSAAPITAGKPFNCTVSATGGTAPYQGTGTFTVTQPVKGTFVESFTVRDANGKTAVASTHVTVVQQPFVVTVTCGSAAPITAGKPFTCTVSATGGTAPYQGTGSFTVTQPVKGTFTESFIVTDSNDKSAIASTTVTVVQQPFVVTVTCGSAAPITAGKPFTCTVSATGGTAPYGGTGVFQRVEPVKGTFHEFFNVTDANGKSAMATTAVQVVQQPFVVTVTCGSTAPITAGKPFTCRVSATGGTAPYQGTGNFTITQPVKGTFTESFTVTDANGKSAVASTQVTVVQQPFVVSVTCGSPTASITAGKPFTCRVTATGGTAPYQGTGNFTVTQPVKGTFTESFTVSDANHKSAVASTQVTVVQQPFVVTVTCGSQTAAITAGKPFTCTVSATGGTAPYQGTGTFTVTQPVKGTFTESFTVTDANGKSAVASTQVTVVQQPFVVSVTCGSPTASITAGKPFTCRVTATGGTAPYHGTGNFTVTQPVKGTFTESFTVTDANGKSATASTQVTVVQQPFVVTVNCGSTAPITAGKPFTCRVTATGGTAPYQGTGTFTVTQPVKGTFTESFTVRDANGKSAIASTQVTVVQQPFVATVNCGSGQTAGKPFTCTVSATGGTAPYQGTGTFTVTQPVKGTFTESFTVRDANGKSTTASTVVRVAAQPLVVDFSFTCSGSFVITFTATASGGTTPYTFSWNFGDTTTGTGNPVTHTYTGAGPFTVTLTLTDANGARTTKSKSVTPCGNVLTDTSFCPLTNNGFRIIFITDPANPSAFRLVSTNPGQFYDNVFDTGTPSTPVSLSIKIPYPFVTNGAFPIQVSSSFNVVGGCFVPAFDQNGNFAVSTTGGNLSPSGHPVILLSDYGSTPTVGVTTTTVTVTGNIPATGLIYVTIHLEYGLKGTSGWTKVGLGPIFPAFNSGIGGGITINDPQSYAFSFTDGTPSSTSPTSNNVWKKDPGFAGVVTTSDAAGANPIAGVTIKIYDNNGILLGITTTDSNGIYLYVYKYTGSKVTYTVKAILGRSSQTVSVIMQSNKLVLQNFTF